MNKLEAWLKFLIISLLAATVAALLSKDDLKTRIITFFSGFFSGLACIIVCSILELGNTIEVISVLIASSFISTIYPLLQRWAQRMTNKKLP